MVTLDLPDHKRDPKVLIQAGAFPRYSSTGHLLYGVQGSVWAVRFDPDRLETIGDPFPVQENVATKSEGAADFDLSGDGALLYVPGGAALATARTLVWVDREGHETPIKAPPRGYAYPRISPDGTHVALDIRDQQNDIWIFSLAIETLTRLTTNPEIERFPVWVNHNGLRIAYSSERDGIAQISWQLADGTGASEQLTKAASPVHPNSFTSNGARLLFVEESGDAGNNIGMIALDGQRTLSPLVKTQFAERNGEVSPDGRWLAYESNESGRTEVYVRAFPDPDMGGRSQVSSNGGTRPVWQRNGRELFYFTGQGQIMSVPVETGTTFRFRNAKQLFSGGQYFAGLNGRTYDVSPNGERFLMVKAVTDPTKASVPLNLVLTMNWFRDLPTRAPGE